MDFLEDIAPEEQEKSRGDSTTSSSSTSAFVSGKRPSFNLGSWAAGFLFLLVFIIVIGFSWQVFSYYQKLQKGQVVLAPDTYASTVASSERLQSLAQGAPGSGALATTDDPYRGNRDAAVTIVEFADFGCPYCAEERFVVEAIARKYPDDVLVIYRDFPLTDIHPGAELAAQAAECAQEQGRFWEFAELVFANQGTFTLEGLAQFADEAGLQAVSYEQCMASGIYEEEVMQDLADGVEAGVTGTPTFFINGIKVEGAIPYGVFDEIVQAFLAEK